ncbi:P-loop containing nucleoside triphosphate hydrolase protein [Blastocladiella britannica]|nr:P-loop containing nucleoside triphosphate hydrolase protein [Blastocladiella britannica]
MADPLAPITPNLLDTALSHVRPSVAVTEQYTRPIPRFAWTAVGGYEPVVRALRAAVVGPLRRPEAYARIGARAPGGVLLFGPPGCGKSLLVHALASEPGLTVVSVKGPELQSKYFGESEARIRALFADARKAAPCVLFFDEMDVVGSKREWSSGSGGSEGGGGTAASVSERVLSTLLNEMDGVQARNGVVVVGCTSRPNAMDDALLRPGRIDQLILVGLPTELDRLAILKSLPARLAHDVSCATIARHTDGCTGGDLVVLVREAGILAMAETPGPYQPKFISWRHVVAAAREVLRVSLPSSAGPDVPPDQGQMIQLLPEAIESMSLHDPESRSNSDDGGDWEDVEEEEMPTLSNEQRVVAAAAIMQPYLAFLNQRSSSALPPRR